MTESIMQKTRECLICHRTEPLHVHHVFFGNANRAKSDKWGCVVYLCPEHHNMSNKGVHFNKELDLQIKQACQIVWEERYGTREAFRAEFGSSWL